MKLMKESDLLLEIVMMEKCEDVELVGIEATNKIDEKTAIGKIRKGIDIFRKDADNGEKETKNDRKIHDISQKDSDNELKEKKIGQKDSDICQKDCDICQKDAITLPEKADQRGTPSIRERACSKTEPIALVPESINLHITQRCNYRCKFCFAKYSEMREELKLEQWKLLIAELVRCGCKKINFAGGEPTLVSFLPELANFAKSKGVFVSIISNGTGITESFLETCGHSVDLIGLSVDSQYASTEQVLGRGLSLKGYNHPNLIRKVANLVHKYGIRLKINTTLTSVNQDEDMNDFIRELRPNRWKVFQVHLLKGINDAFFDKFGAVTLEAFQRFLERHRALNPVGESSETIKESYCMVTPDGRFYQDTDNFHHYSRRILEVGAAVAFRDIQFDSEKYLFRGGNFFKS